MTTAATQLAATQLAATPLAATPLSTAAAVGAAVFYLTAVLTLVALWVSAVTSIVRSDQLTRTGRLVWIAGVVAFPFVGSLVWLTVGRHGVPKVYRSQLA